jgi:cell division transport system permease protein
MSLASAGTVTISLLVLAVILLTAVNLEYMLSTVESQVELKAYLADEVAEKSLSELTAKIKETAGVAEATFVTKEEALDRLREQFREQPEVIELVEQNNPLRDSFEIKVVPPEMVREVAEVVAAYPGVAEMKYKQELVDSLFKVTRALRMAGLILVGLMAVATVFIISNTIRLTVFARRREVAIMKLVGATDGFIRGPFTVEGVLLGLIGALAAMVFVWIGYGWVVSKITSFLPLWPIAPRQPLLTNLTGGLLALGAFLGALGSAISLRRFLKV